MHVTFKYNLHYHNLNLNHWILSSFIRKENVDNKNLLRPKVDDNLIRYPFVVRFPNQSNQNSPLTMGPISLIFMPWSTLQPKPIITDGQSRRAGESLPEAATTHMHSTCSNRRTPAAVCHSLVVSARSRSLEIPVFRQLALAPTFPRCVFFILVIKNNICFGARFPLLLIISIYYFNF